MKRGTPRHPKVYALLQELGLTVRQRATAIGYLELLWHFTAEFAPRGDIGKYSDDRIEGACDWTGKRGRLVEALVRSGWLDLPKYVPNPVIEPATKNEWWGKSDRSELVVHDWHEHADGAVKKKLERSGIKFVSLTKKVTRQRPQRRGKTAAADLPALPVPTPTPLPVPHPVRGSATKGEVRKLPSMTEYPKTESAILSKYQAADSTVVTRIVEATIQAHLSVDNPKVSMPDDAAIAEAVEIAYREAGKKQTSVMLFMRTVPAVITGWAKRGRPTPQGLTSMYDDADDWKKNIDFEQLARERAEEEKRGKNPAS